MYSGGQTETFLYGSRLGAGGLGLQAEKALASLDLLNHPIHAIGPGESRAGFHNVTFSSLEHRVRPTKIFFGRAQYGRDKNLGFAALERIRILKPKRVYGFTQVSMETAAWCVDNGIPFILDNPNSHIRNFARVYREESLHWFKVPYLGHPTRAMVRRVEREYELATRIRVSSLYAKKRMEELGVSQEKIVVQPQFMDLDKFQPASEHLGY